MVIPPIKHEARSVHGRFVGDVVAQHPITSRCCRRSSLSYCPFYPGRSLINGTFSEVKEAMFAHMSSLQLL